MLIQNGANLDARNEVRKLYLRVLLVFHLYYNYATEWLYSSVYSNIWQQERSSEFACQKWS